MLHGFFLDDLEAALELQEGRVLKVHHGKGAHEAVAKGIRSLALARVGAPVEMPGKNLTQAREPDVFLDMQRWRPREQVIPALRGSRKMTGCLVFYFKQ